MHSVRVAQLALNMRRVPRSRAMATSRQTISASEVLSGIPWSIVSGALVAKLSWDLWERNIEHDYGWQNVAVAMGATPVPEKKRKVSSAATQSEQRKPIKIAVLKHVSPDTEIAAQAFMDRMWNWVRVWGPVGAAFGSYAGYTATSVLEAAQSEQVAKMMKSSLGATYPNVQSIGFTAIRTVLMGVCGYVGAYGVYSGGRFYFETCSDKVALLNFLEALADGTKWSKWNRDGTRLIDGEKSVS